METYAARRERIARLMATYHFDRRPWRGACTKAERTAWLVNKYWDQWAALAEEVIASREPLE